jgi:Flp pilus assembly protein TadG
LEDETMKREKTMQRNQINSKLRSGWRRRGTATLELALTLSILFSVCWGTIEFGYYFFVKNTMEGAAREGCRAGIVAGGNNSTVNAAILNQLKAAGLVPSSTTAPSSMPCTIGNYSISCTDNGSAITDVTAAVTGDTLTLTITATWGTVGAGFRPMAMIGASKTVSAACAMRVEG